MSDPTQVLAELDALERRDPQQREQELMRALPQLVARAQGAPGWARILNGVEAGAITSRAALAQLPVTRKSDLKELQTRESPFGGLNTTPARQLRRLFVSPGPIWVDGGDWSRVKEGRPEFFEATEKTHPMACSP